MQLALYHVKTIAGKRDGCQVRRLSPRASAELLEKRGTEEGT